ncbi:MAG: DUF6273 domain-containing protein [Christensenellales bacterium]
MTFDTMGGSSIASVQVNSGDRLSAPSQPSKKSYVFGGWYKESQCQNEWNFEADSVNSNVTLYAKWDECINHTPNSNCVCSKCGEEAHDLDGDCVCRICKEAFHNVDSDCLCARCGDTIHMADGKYCKHEDVIYFGYYPQTEVKDSNITSALTTQAGSLPTSGNAGSWTSYGYYDNGAVSDYMWYVDISYQDNNYRGVYFSQYRLKIPSDTGSSEKSYQDDNEYFVDTVYWFKYEPISWKVLQESGESAFLLCDIALDSQSFDYKGGSNYNNNYAESTIRAWLNDTFYNTAFSSLQKELILMTMVDNSVESTGNDENPYACEDTEDKIFLLSCKEAISYDLDRASRKRKSTDYAKSQGCWQDTKDGYIGNCYWWLRSPDNRESNHAHGADVTSTYVDYTHYGIVPALWIRL